MDRRQAHEDQESWTFKHPVIHRDMQQMTQEQQQDAFADELDALISRFVTEFDLTVSSAIGVLETAKLQLFMRETTDEIE